jgi:hypothetical protein
MVWDSGGYKTEAPNNSGSEDKGGFEDDRGITNVTGPPNIQGPSAQQFIFFKSL